MKELPTVLVILVVAVLVEAFFVLALIIERSTSWLVCPNGVSRASEILDDHVHRGSRKRLVTWEIRDEPLIGPDKQRASATMRLHHRGRGGRGRGAEAFRPPEPPSGNRVGGRSSERR